jgi:hypothetical protein
MKSRYSSAAAFLPVCAWLLQQSGHDSARGFMCVLLVPWALPQLYEITTRLGCPRSRMPNARNGRSSSCNNRDAPVFMACVYEDIVTQS